MNLLLPGEKSLELVRQRGLESQSITRPRMFKTQNGGVQCETLGFPAWMLCQFRLVPIVAQHRMSGLGKMDTNLVPPSRLQ